MLTNIKVENAREAAGGSETLHQQMERGCEDLIRFLEQAFKMEKFLINKIPAIGAWFFFISAAFSVLFEIKCWEKISGWIIKLGQPFGKDVRLNYYRISQGLKEFLYLLLPSLLPLPRSP